MSGRKIKNFLTIVAIFMASIICLSFLMRLIPSLQLAGFSEEIVDGNVDDGSGVIISDGENNGISLLSTASGDSNSYTITATVTSSIEYTYTLDWSIAWDTEWDGYNTSSDSDCEDVNGDGWYCGDLSLADITDYVTLSEAKGYSVTVTCLQAFGNPLIITCSVEGSTCSATCYVDYQCRITGIGQLTLYEYCSSTNKYTQVWYGTSSGITRTFTLPDYASEREEEDNYRLTFAQTPISGANCVSLGVGTVKPELGYCITLVYSYSGYHLLSYYYYDNYGYGWYDFCNDLFGYSYYSDRDTLYSELYNLYSNDEAAVTVTLSVTDDKTGTSYTKSWDMYIDPAGLI